MKEYLIGTGGWAYFQVPGIRSLVAYSRAFDFVEVNSTFYSFPSQAQAEDWRRSVPEEFQFSVRAHHSITHKHRLRPNPAAVEAFEKTIKICRTLKAEILHLQTPPSYVPNSKSLEDFQDLLNAVTLNGIRLAVEFRGIPSVSDMPARLLKILQDHAMIHCIDLSKGEAPVYESDILYARLFGKGRHNIYQPTDGELQQIDQTASNSKAEKVVMSFHFVRMYKDAVRLKAYKQTGAFPPVTRSTGIASLEEVLREDSVFPTTKQGLISSQGWKLFDLTRNRRVRTREFLKRLPKGEYSNLEEVLGNLSI